MSIIVQFLRELVCFLHIITSLSYNKKKYVFVNTFFCNYLIKNQKTQTILRNESYFFALKKNSPIEKSSFRIE